MTETWAEEVKRLQREIAERQARLMFLVCGDPRQSVTVQTIYSTQEPPEVSDD